MPSIKYLARILSGVRWKKISDILDRVQRLSGQSKVHTFFDIAWCAVRYGAGYYDYVLCGFYDLTPAQRDTYLTRIRYKKVCNVMNDISHSWEFGDKNHFNEKFAKYMRRKTLNGETATLEQFTEFIDGQEAIFAKMNHGEGGESVEKLYVKDFDSPDAMFDYVRAKKEIVLEHVLMQHPDVARLHPQSVNTIRLVTDRVGDQVYVTYAAIRIGGGDSVCDNACQGGMYCHVDPETGKICSPAMDDFSHILESHPDTGITFNGYQLPMIPEAVEMAKEAMWVIPEITHVGWDVGITPDGPAFIEGNDFPGDMYQIYPFCPGKRGLWPYYKELLHL